MVLASLPLYDQLAQAFGPPALTFGPAVPCFAAAPTCRYRPSSYHDRPSRSISAIDAVGPQLPAG